MQRKFLSTKEFQAGLTTLIKTSNFNTKVATTPSFINQETGKYIIPEHENENLDQIAEEAVPYFSNIHNQNPHHSTPQITETGLYAEIMDGVFMNPNFSWDCNPAAADLEILTGEILRNQIGLDEKFSYGLEGMGKLCLNFNDAFILCLQECRISRDVTSSYKAGGEAIVYGIDKIDQKKALNMFEIKQSRTNMYSDSLGTKLDFGKLEAQLEADSQTDATVLMFMYTPRNIEYLTEELTHLLTLKEKYGFDIFLNLEALDYEPLIKSLENIGELSQEIDFAYIDNSKFTGLATNTFFIPNREGLKTSLMIVEKEYYKAKNVAGDMELDEEALITKNKYTAHHYNIGFGHGVGVYRIFASLQMLGVEGLTRMWNEQIQSLS